VGGGVALGHRGERATRPPRRVTVSRGRLAFVSMGKRAGRVAAAVGRIPRAAAGCCAGPAWPA
jgi:hypothetical protein